MEAYLDDIEHVVKGKLLNIEVSVWGVWDYDEHPDSVDIDGNIRYKEIPFVRGDEVSEVTVWSDRQNKYADISKRLFKKISEEIDLENLDEHINWDNYSDWDNHSY